MSSKYLQPTTIKDALTVAKNIRVEDQREIEGLGHTLGILPWCVVNSVRPVTLYHNEKPDTIVGVCGIVPDEDNPRIGSVWLICTQDVETVNPITFIRESKRWLESELSLIHI